MIPGLTLCSKPGKVFGGKGKKSGSFLRKRGGFAQKLLKQKRSAQGSAEKVRKGRAEGGSSLKLWGEARPSPASEKIGVNTATPESEERKTEKKEGPNYEARPGIRPGRTWTKPGGYLA